MIDLSLNKMNELVGGLNFQIGFFNQNLDINYFNSIAVSEDAFALIEAQFASEFPKNHKKHIYYHWGTHFHDIEAVERIVDRLKDRKQHIERFDFKLADAHWFSGELVSFLNANKKLVTQLIDGVIAYISVDNKLNKNGIYVIGI